MSDLKLRPIVAGPSCLTHRLSNLLDILLRPHTKYIKATCEIQLISSTTFQREYNLVLYWSHSDIEALYSNIAHELGLEAVKYWLEKYPEKNHRFSSSFILEAIKLILENNTFCFNDNFYKQIKGTAMGTKFAPVYATLTIGYLEENYMNKSKQFSGMTLEIILFKTGNAFSTTVLSHGLENIAQYLKHLTERY